MGLIKTLDEARQEALLSKKLKAWETKRQLWRMKMKKVAEDAKKSLPLLNAQERARLVIDNMTKQRIDFFRAAGMPITETEARKYVESIAYRADNRVKKVIK